MEITQKSSVGRHNSLTFVKSFLIWSFTLTVCLLVVGFPLIVLMAAVGALGSVILQSVLPISSVLLVAGSLIGANILAIILVAAMLTLRGVHHQEVSWLRWLHGEAKPSHSSVYASCPLTCNVAN